MSSVLTPDLLYGHRTEYLSLDTRSSPFMSGSAETDALMSSVVYVNTAMELAELLFAVLRDVQYRDALGEFRLDPGNLQGLEVMQDIAVEVGLVGLGLGPIVIAYRSGDLRGAVSRDGTADVPSR